MRYIIAIALSIILLASAAAAIVNGNTIKVEISEEAEDNQIVGVTLAQVTGAVSDLFGNNNEVEQYKNLIANDNSLAGFGDDFSSELNSSAAITMHCRRLMPMPMRMQWP